ncbi:MAG: hypothetical protein ACJ768_04690 [Gaiellaceae bacterium]
MQDDIEAPETGVQWLVVLRVVTLIAGAVWVLSRVYYEMNSANGPSSFSSTDNIVQRLNWAQAIGDVAYAVFLFSAVAYVILWLQRRDANSPVQTS